MSYIDKKETILDGKWYQIKYADAFEGAIGKLFFEYTKEIQNDSIFYGISSHNEEDGFAYFIGLETNTGNLVLPEGWYLKSFVSDIAYETYQKIAKENHKFKALFDSKFDFDSIPTKIEKYHYKDDHAILVEILIPLESK